MNAKIKTKEELLETAKQRSDEDYFITKVILNSDAKALNELPKKKYISWFIAFSEPELEKALWKHVDVITDCALLMQGETITVNGNKDIFTFAKEYEIEIDRGVCVNISDVYDKACRNRDQIMERLSGFRRKK